MTGNSFFEDSERPPQKAVFERRPRPQEERQPWDWSFGVTVLADLTLAENLEGACLLRSLIAYRTGFRFTIEAQLRRPLKLGPGTRGNNAVSFRSRTMPGNQLGSGLVQVGIRTSDQEKYTERRQEGQRHVLLSHGSRGSSSSGSGDYFFVGLPSGNIELWIAWMAAGIPETCHVLDGDAIRAAGESARTLWVDV